MFKINNKNLISFFLSSLAIISFGVILIPKNVNADVCNTWFENGASYSACNNNYRPNTYSNNNYNTTNPAPYINSINPKSAKINAGAITIMVSGNNFMPNSVVRLNDTDRPTTFIDPGTLRAQLDYYDLRFKGSYQVTVFNPAPGGGFSNPVSFTIYENVVSSTNTSTTRNTNTTNSTYSNNTTDQSTNTNNNTDASDLAANAIFGKNAFMPSSLLQWFFFAILILLAVILWRKLYVSDNDRSTPLKHA